MDSGARHRLFIIFGWRPLHASRERKVDIGPFHRARADPDTAWLQLMIMHDHTRRPRIPRLGIIQMQHFAMRQASRYSATSGQGRTNPTTVSW